MQTEMALDRLQDVREVVDGEAAELVDALAQILVLKQDLSSPMHGAKVTIYQRPDGEYVEVDPAEAPEDFSDAEQTWRWMSHPGDDDERVVKRFDAWTEVETVDEDSDELPDVFDPDGPLEDDLEAAEDLPTDWSIYNSGYVRNYKRRELDPDGTALLERRALVFEPYVADAPAGDYWDPNEKEYREPEEYPMGTVNVVHAPSDDVELGDGDYVSDVDVATSIVPAEGEPSSGTYTPGWPEE